MSKTFKLGDFFGITATQLALFKPKSFDKLLEYRYTSRVNEGLFSLAKEIEFLLNTLKSSATSPDFDSLADSFKYSGYLGLNPNSKETQIKGAIAKFNKFYQENELEVVKAKYGEDTQDMIDAIQEKQTIDLTAITKKFESSNQKGSRSLTPDAQKIIKTIFDNTGYLRELQEKCKTAYVNNQYDDLTILNKSIKDILTFDSESAESDMRSSSIFCGQLYKEVNRWHNNTEHKMEYFEAIKIANRNIHMIQNGYKPNEIQFVKPDTVALTLEEVFNDISLGNLRDILGREINDEDADKVFEELDDYEFGGLGLNGLEMSKSHIQEMQGENTSWARAEIKKNEKLDTLMRMLYIDLQSKMFMIDVEAKGG